MQLGLKEDAREEYYKIPEMILVSEHVIIYTYGHPGRNCKHKEEGGRDVDVSFWLIAGNRILKEKKKSPALIGHPASYRRYPGRPRVQPWH